jgi:hypothetical protein
MYEAWRYIPSKYLICEADKALPPAAQEHVVARSAGAIVAERCSAGHSPFLSQPDVVVKLVQEIATD